MVERFEFTPEDQEEIGLIALQLAELGPDAIFDLRLAKVYLIAGLMNHTQTLPVGEIADFLKASRYDIQVINEVLRQAVSIRQLMGLDDELDLLMSADDE